MKATSLILEDIVQKDDASWQYLIYELVKTNQIDPWDVNIIELTNKFLAKIEEMDRKNLHISSKVLLVAAILVKLKADFLYNSLIKKEEKKKEIESIEVNEEVPLLLPKIPIFRDRKITLEELMNALKNAIKTEERRMRREVSSRRMIDFSFIIPKKRINWLDKIKEVYNMIKEMFIKNKVKKIYFSQLLRTNEKEEKITLFVPLLHLDHQNKVKLEQKAFLSEIEISLKENIAPA